MEQRQTQIISLVE